MQKERSTHLHPEEGLKRAGLQSETRDAQRNQDLISYSVVCNYASSADANIDSWDIVVSGGVKGHIPQAAHHDNHFTLLFMIYGSGFTLTLFSFLEYLVTVFCES